MGHHLLPKQNCFQSMHILKCYVVLRRHLCSKVDTAIKVRWPTEHVLHSLFSYNCRAETLTEKWCDLYKVLPQNVLASFITGHVYWHLARFPNMRFYSMLFRIYAMRCWSSFARTTRAGSYVLLFNVYNYTAASVLNFNCVDCVWTSLFVFYFVFTAFRWYLSQFIVGLFAMLLPAAVQKEKLLTAMVLY